MTSGDKGVTIVVDAGGYAMSGIATLIAAPGASATTIGAAERLGPCVIAPDGLTAVYTTSGSDFLIGGPWQLQLEVSTSVGQVFTSQPAPIYIYPLL